MLPASRNDIARVVVILAGPRTGSSYLFRALKHAGRFLAPTGEETPFYRRAGLGIFNGSHYSDSIVEKPVDSVLNLAANELLQDVGELTYATVDPTSMAKAFVARASLQWPNAIQPELATEQRRLLQERFTQLSNRANWPRLYSEWLTELQVRGVAVDAQMLHASTDHPNELALLEEPPFVTPDPKIPLHLASAIELPLLLKTSTNVYRLPLLRALFPNAQFKWIVLKRNPAATVSALMSGWLSSGFHSHNLHPHCALKIKGYSDVVPGGDRFWKFDLPPGWQDFTSATLQEVCAFQWLSSYRALKSRKFAEPTLEISYEDLLLDEAQVLNRILQFAQTQPHEARDSSETQPIMSVTPPQNGKWKQREETIRGLVTEFADGELGKMARNMGYDTEQMENWP